MDFQVPKALFARVPKGPLLCNSNVETVFMLKSTMTFFVLLLSNVSTFAQTPRFESSEECLEWFLISWDRLDNKSACYGTAHVSGSSSEGFVVFEWFEVRFNDRSNHKTYRYVESRRTYADGVQADLWEKSMTRDKEWKWCVGDYSKEMRIVPVPEFNEKGEQIGGARRWMKTPDVFAFSVITGSAFQTDFGRFNSVSKAFEQLKQEVVETKIDDEKLQGFFQGGGKWAAEIVFDQQVGGMPVSTRGYFRDVSKKGAPDRSFFQILNFISKTEWETVGLASKYYAPVAVTNFVHRLNPKSKNSKVIEIKAAWDIDGVGSELFSDDSIARSYEDDGPLVKLRKKLTSKIQNVQGPKSDR